jgi:hypothetical protein
MILELPTEQVLKLMQSSDALELAVGEAIAVLPPDMLEHLGSSGEASAPPSPDVVSPASVMAGPMKSDGGWADCDEEDEDLPCVNELFASAARKRAAKTQQGPDAMETDDGFVCEWDAASMAAEPKEKLCEFIAARLQEPQVRIVVAVVELLGTDVALSMLERTERCLHAGGMIVEETGKPRTAGGIFLKLLRDASDLPAEAQAATVLRIKKEGDDAKKAQRKALAAKRKVAIGKKEAAQSPSTERGPPKPSLADFFVNSPVRPIA